jgi:hypothetical protein
VPDAGAGVVLLCHLIAPQPFHSVICIMFRKIAETAAMHLLPMADVVPNGACSAALIAYSHQNPAFYTREKAGFCMLKGRLLFAKRLRFALPFAVFYIVACRPALHTFATLPRKTL